MAELLLEYQNIFADADGTTYRARACGRQTRGGLWEGWIEFVPTDGGKTLRSRRETTQPNRVDAVYWATGISNIYLQGAFDRAQHPLVVAVPPPPQPPAYDGPAGVREIEVEVMANHDAVLDPFSVYDKGETLLRQELAALSPWHLANIVEAFELSDEDRDVLERLSRATLVELIVAAVRRERDVTTR